MENVNVHLSGTDNAFQVDSTFGGNTTVGGGTNTTVTLSSSLSGLHPETQKRVAFLAGTVSVTAANIVLDDSGNDQRTTGTLESDRVTGLGIPGTVTFAATQSTTIKLGANDDTFYVPATADGQSVRLETGRGYDTVHVGTGTLAGLQGSLFIDGGPLLTGVNTLFLNDQDTTAPQIYTVTNDYDWTDTNSSTRAVIGADDNGDGLIRIEVASTAGLATGDQVVIAGMTGTTEANGTWTITEVDSSHFDLQGSNFENGYVSGGTVFTNTNDTTTITRAGEVIVQYIREEIVALNGGQGGNTIDIQQTHREQSTDGSTSSTFTVNTGIGNDIITLGAPVGNNGQFSMTGFQQDVVAPTFTGPEPSRRGIPVLINSQGGDDTVAIRDTASTTSASLAFTQTQFRDLFPADPDARVDSVDVFSAVFGENPLARPFTTVVLAQDEQRPVNISIRESLSQAQRIQNQNLQLTVSLGSVNNSATSLTPSSFSVSDPDNQLIFAANPNLTAGQALVYHQGSGNGSMDLADGQIYYVKLVNGSPDAIQLALTTDGNAVDLKAATSSLDTLGTATFTPSSTSVVSNSIIFAANPGLTANQAVVYHQGNGNGSIGLNDGQSYYVKLVSGNPNAIQLALTAEGDAVPLNFSEQWLAPVGNVVQLTSAAYESDIIVNAGDGNDTFNVENGVRMTNGHTLLLNGGDGDDTTYVDFNGISIIDPGNLAQTVTDVTFSREQADSGKVGHNPLLPGTYYVETRWSGSQWQFRVVDLDGNPVPVADVSKFDRPVTGAANNGNGLIRIAVASTANLATGDEVSIAGVNGTTEANQNWTITVIDPTHFDLQESTFTNAYIGGGTITTSVLLPSWQNISQLPVVGVPDAETSLDFPV